MSGSVDWWRAEASVVGVVDFVFLFVSACTAASACFRGRVGRGLGSSPPFQHSVRIGMSPLLYLTVLASSSVPSSSAAPPCSCFSFVIFMARSIAYASVCSVLLLAVLRSFGWLWHRFSPCSRGSVFFS